MGRKIVLIVDDEPDIVTFLNAFLDDHGYESCSAVDGTEAIAAMRSRPPDLVLMDLKMPNETGLQVYRTMQADESLRRIPVIFVTGLAEFQLFDTRCTPLPAPAATVTKPIDGPTLLAAVRRALAR